MPRNQIILADGPRLLRDLFKQIFDKTDNLSVVGEAEDPTSLTELLGQFKIRWVVTCMPPGEELPDWIEISTVVHPRVHFLAVSSDGSAVRIIWSHPAQEIHRRISLPDLIVLLRGETPVPKNEGLR